MLEPVYIDLIGTLQQSSINLFFRITMFWMNQSPKIFLFVSVCFYVQCKINLLFQTF